jgi:macrolide-specific efflux system membrane fusion protein
MMKLSRPSNKVLKRLGIGLLIVIACVVYFKRSGSDKGASNVMTAVVKKGNIEDTVLASGTLKPIKLVAVGAQVSGRITKLHVALGQTVKKGDLIAEIDSVTQQNSVKTTEASLANTRAQLAEKEASLVLATQTLTRQTQMIQKNAISQADFDSAEATVRTTKAQIDGLKAQIIASQVAVDTAKVNLGYTKITAPTDGTVLAIVSQEGQTVNAMQTAPTIVVLGQLETMTIRAEISEADVVRVQPGNKAYFTILGNPNHRFNASLESIEPAPTSITSDSSISTSSSSSSTTTSAIYYNGIFHVDNSDHQLRTYMTAEIHIIIGSAQDVLTLPSAALGRRNKDGEYTVTVKGKDGKTSQKTITVGLNNKINAEIKSGLEEGEEVVIGFGAASQTDTQRSFSNRPPMRM